MDELMDDLNADEDMISPDERRPWRILDSRRQADGELSDSDDEGEGGRRNHASEGATSGRKFGIGVGIMSSSQRNVGTGLNVGGSGTGGLGRVGTGVAAVMDVDSEGPTVSENGVNGTHESMSRNGSAREQTPVINGTVDVDDEKENNES